jgi:transposase
LIPPAKPRGNKRSVDLREVVNGLMYILSTGCQWHAIPKDLAARNTVYDYFDRWSWDGTLERKHHAFYVKCREQVSREVSPTVAIVDARASRARKRAAHTSTRTGMTRARRSKARSGMFWSIPGV